MVRHRSSGRSAGARDCGSLSDARPHAIRLLDIGVLPERQWSSLNNSRRPVELGATT
jgi:hypothetical protein